ncbi:MULTISPECIES: hypothetical protein [unclassified Exiguobacterium]|uniref:hypothetical protein n=1 Tax=unclassified Exiguobacterium TaxID=2644629 RepID=UPI001BE9EACA|nr:MULTISPECIES: hypothetical protein [unclassified Exiguobacterium]
MGVRFDIKMKVDNTAKITRKVQSNSERAMNDIVDNLVKASSGATPIDKGILQDSWAKKVTASGNKVSGQVSYAALAKNGFNYALKMHEGFYNLGEGSQAKSGGKGMSGRVYPVGRRFLAGTFEGEQATYKNHMSKEIKNAIKSATN